MSRTKDKLKCYIYNKEGIYSIGITIPYTAKQIASFIILTKSAYRVQMEDPKIERIEFETLAGDSWYLDYARDKDFLEKELLPELIPLQEGNKKPEPLKILSWGCNYGIHELKGYFYKNFNVNFNNIPFIDDTREKV